MTWTEEAIRKALEGHFYTFDMSTIGFKIVDEETRVSRANSRAHYVKGPWSNDELRLLKSLKEAGFSTAMVAEKLQREPKRVQAKWGRREKWEIATNAVWSTEGQKKFTPRKTVLLVDDIIESVARVSSLPRVAIESGGRAKILCEARQVIFWIARNYTKKSFPRLGEIMGKDHSTILHGVQKVDARFEYFRGQIESALFDLGLELKAKEAA